MDSADLNVLETAAAWLQRGHAAWLATVAETWGSSPRPQGALWALRDDGAMVGSVSGGCVEAILAERLLKTTPTAPAIHEFGVTSEENRRLGLPCGGRLKLIVESLSAEAPLRKLIEAIRSRQPIRRHLCLATGEVSLGPARSDAGFRFDGRDLYQIFGPAWRLLIIGAGQPSYYLAQMALALDFEVVVCDPREDYQRSWQLPQIRFVRSMPDDTVRELADDPRSAVVALTHDPKLDDMALMEALDCRAYYVGALGSQRSNAARRRRLAQIGVSAAGLMRLHGPVGLPLGSRRPAEIALAIAADLVAQRNGVQLVRATPAGAAPKLAAQ